MFPLTERNVKMKAQSDDIFLNPLRYSVTYLKWVFYFRTSQRSVQWVAEHRGRIPNNLPGGGCKLCLGPRDAEAKSKWTVCKSFCFGCYLRIV